MSLNLRRILSFVLIFLFIAANYCAPMVLAEESDALPAVGDVIFGFTVDSITQSNMLDSEMIAFTHEQSGARLLYIKNDDPEVAFSISYRTPYVDETDTNHIFEHAIIASSEKYPSTDIFFDLVSRTYNTYINASTYPAFTTYPISSMSEEQLLKMMDVYLSCMVAPDILENENIFKREALRYTLYDADEEISMIGTVFSEDFGSLTDISWEASNNVLDALYPGEYVSNSSGRAHLNYEDLSYEATLETYDRCYHFDNSLILLYGDLSYETFLEFIDSEYLSKEERNGTDLSAYQDGPTEAGHVEVTVPMPAFEGDAVENASQVDYAISVADASLEDLVAWDLLSTILCNENSALYSQMKALGIQNQAVSYINPYVAKPFLEFILYNAQPEQAETFHQAVISALEQVAKEGVDEEIMRSTLKQMETRNYLLRDAGNVGVNIFPNIAAIWTLMGELDYYETFEQVLDTLEQDDEQEIFRRLASEAVSAERTALVTTTPEPGLAEEIIAEQDAYLAEMKASMSEEEIQQLIQDTLEFDAWNEQSISNSDFVIDPQDIQDATAYTNFTKIEDDSIDYYLAPAEVENVGCFYLGFDASEFSNDELLDFSLYKLLIGLLDTQEHTDEELLNLMSEYLYDWSMSSTYPMDQAEEVYPIQAVKWICLTQDYEQALALLMDMFANTDFSDTARIEEILARYADEYDRSRDGDSLTLAFEIAGSYTSNRYAYSMMCEGQEFYYYLKDIQQMLSEDVGFGAELAARMDAVAEKLLKKGRMVFIAAAPEEDLEQIQQITAQTVDALPSREAGEVQVVLERSTQKLAVAVESSDQYTCLVGNCYMQEDFQGRYIPFLMAAVDQYIVPKLRFQMGAYSGGATVNLYTGMISLYSYSDPNAAATLEVFDGIEEFIAEMDLTQEDLDSYILTSLSSFGQSVGVLQEPMQAVECEILGYDLQTIADMVNDMKSATLEDQQAAAEAIGALFDGGSTVTCGNETVLAQDQEAYDQFISYKSNRE